MRRQKVLFLLAIACSVGAAAFGTARLALPLRTQPELLGTAWRYFLSCMALAAAGGLLMTLSRKK